MIYLGVNSKSPQKVNTLKNVVMRCKFLTEFDQNHVTLLRYYKNQNSIKEHKLLVYSLIAKYGNLLAASEYFRENYKSFF